MCQCLAENRRPKSAFSPEWLSDTGQVVHPDAPASTGGAGSFRSPGLFASDGGAGELLPHPRSPAARTLDPALVQQAEELEAAKAARQPPPKVGKETTELIRGMTVKIKPDVSGVAGISGAFTDFANTSTGLVSQTSDEKGIVTTVTNTLAWTLVIQTQYGSGTPDSDSAYGRGTTKDDKDKGLVTLGFHESCHRQDLVDFFKAKETPVFTGAKGQTSDAFQKAMDSYTAAWDAYFAAARANTLSITDEVGDPTKTKYEAGAEEP